MNRSLRESITIMSTLMMLSLYRISNSPCEPVNPDISVSELPLTLSFSSVFVSLTPVVVPVEVLSVLEVESAADVA